MSKTVPKASAPVVQGIAYHGSLHASAADLSLDFVERQDGLPAFLKAFRVSESVEYGNQQRACVAGLAHRYDQDGLRRAPDRSNPKEIAQATLLMVSLLEDDAKQILRKSIAKLRGDAKGAGVRPEWKEVMREAARLIEAGGVANPRDGGHLFTVRLDAHRPCFLLWNDSLEVQSQVRHALVDAGYRFDPKMSGAEVFGFLTEYRTKPGEPIHRRSMPNPNAAGEVLLAAGLSGLRYPDPTSRMVAVAPKSSEQEWRIHAGTHPTGREIARVGGGVTRNVAHEVMERHQSFQMICLDPAIVSIVACDGVAVSPVRLRVSSERIEGGQPVGQYLPAEEPPASSRHQTL